MNYLDDPTKWAREASGRPLWFRVLVGVAVALAFGVAIAMRDSVSHGDVGLKIAMAITGVVAIALVAPGMFTGINRDPNDWGDEIKALEARSKDKPTGESKPASGQGS